MRMVACGEPFGWLSAYWLSAAQQSFAALIEARRNRPLNNISTNQKGERTAKQAIDQNKDQKD
jgi:hypothetical protein